MLKPKLIVATVVVGVCLAGWTLRSATSMGEDRGTVPDRRGALPARSATSLPAIGHLRTRDRIITILSSDGAPVYTIRTTGGEVLFRELSEEDLEAKLPEVHRLIKSAFAGGDDPDGVVIDASLWPYGTGGDMPGVFRKQGGSRAVRVCPAPVWEE